MYTSLHIHNAYILMNFGICIYLIKMKKKFPKKKRNILSKWRKTTPSVSYHFHLFFLLQRTKIPPLNEFYPPFLCILTDSIQNCDLLIGPIIAIPTHMQRQGK